MAADVAQNVAILNFLLEYKKISVAAPLRGLQSTYWESVRRLLAARLTPTGSERRAIQPSY